MKVLTKIIFLFLVSIFAVRLDAAFIYMDWHVAVDYTINPISFTQPVITINGMFPGPLINATTNDIIRVNVFNDMDIEPLLITWNGIQQRLNSWQDGVSGTNCPILAGKNWTYEFQVKDQIGSFFYSPSINFIKAAGGYGPIRVNNRNVIAVPFPKPEAEFDLLIGDWFYTDYKFIRSAISQGTEFFKLPDALLMNGNGPFGHPSSKSHESLTVEKGKTYRLRISNVGTGLSFNFRIEKHRMVVVETEGSYTDQIELDSLDVHVGQSYSVLVTADQEDGVDYYIVASPKLVNTSTDSTKETLVARGVLHYKNSNILPSGPFPKGPDPFDLDFSINQAKSIRWNMTAGAARPNPQGTFNVSNVTLSQTFILHGSKSYINGAPRNVVNNVSYIDQGTPVKLADYFVNGSGIYDLDKFPKHHIRKTATYKTSVVSGTHKGWLEIVFHNDFSNAMDSWHLDGFGFYVVGFGHGEWSPSERSTYNLLDPVVRSTVQVYPGGWSAVYAYMDNPGMWNLRSQHLMNWYLGQELYVRVHDDDPNPAKERPPPNNLLLCG
ncbi:monocopper oxidase-like protein SKU5 [Impatiens glandulifera]|uniref:monocopper oxidase-like protein SKU5 n=1 Tax=Impatiens glandulifera TaxID=253017 RepID=UPI001FB0FC5D|nr:monocopper oxidase-like protein SKU5 [Impatiens glandulifera]